MSDSRSRFEAWIMREYPDFPSQLWREGDGYVYTQDQWNAWQAAEAATAKVCAEIALRLSKEREGWAMAMRDGARWASQEIREAFPEAFK